jgi:PRTRC genetic system protein B
MNVYLRTGTSRTFRLKHAILLYEDGAATFATFHDIRTAADAAPQLSAGRVVTAAFLHTLARGLKRDIRPEILPENVLMRTTEAIAWWTRARRRPMFFRGADPKAEVLNGKIYPHPALVFLISDNDLYVRALSEEVRPSADTRLKNAPYWNADARGLVCQGDMPAPDDVSVGAIRGWEEAYFQSAFTHPNGAVRLTTHSKGFHGLWTELIGKREFPNGFLADSKETLQAFIEARTRC